MKKPNAVDSLRETIRLLEIRQQEEKMILREQIFIAAEQLKPVNLIKSTLRQLLESSEVKTGLLGTLVSVASGYLTQRISRGARGSSLMKTLGIVLQLGMGGLVSGNIENIRNFVNRQFSRITSLR